MSSKTSLWEAVKQPPKEALTAILEGRLKGKSDINPQWRYFELTKQFGPCGIGWKYTVDKKWLEPGADDEIVAFADISLCVKVEDQWSEAIPGHGGSKFVQREKRGTPAERLYTNDEAYKMAVTDALSVALKVLGFGADVYMGYWDGSKYAVSATESGERLNHWLILCEEASQGPRDEFKKWWPAHKDEIRKECGDAGAAEIYSQFAATLKQMRPAE